MKRLLVVAILQLMFTAWPTPAQTSASRFFGRFGRAIARLKSVQAVSNYDRGWGESNQFYLLSKECLREGAVADFTAMLADRNPVVRAMGLLCLAQTSVGKHYLTVLSHTEDAEQVYFYEGCVVSQITVGGFAKRVLENPYFLEAEGKRPAK